jgi:pyrimidine-specific ribonucleoside hydrolase
MTNIQHFLFNLGKSVERQLAALPARLRQTLAALSVLLPVIAIESVGQGRLNLWILPFLFAGVLIGMRRGWPLWSGWWLSWLLVVIGNAWAFAGPARLPVLFILWKPALLIALGFMAYYIWQRGDGFLTTFMLLPAALEFSHLALFADLPTSEAGRFYIARGVSMLVYASAAGLCFGTPLKRRWWVLFAAIAIQLTADIAISFPTIGGFFLYPSFLATLVFIAFGVALLGLTLDGWRPIARWWKQLGRMAAMAAILVIALLPWLVGDAHFPASRAPSAAQTASGMPVIIDTDMSHDDILAILYLLQRPDLDIRAITVVNGVAHVEPGVENARRLLALAGRTDIPVAGGEEVPLAGGRAFPADWRPLLDLGLRVALPSVPPQNGGPSAAELIIQQVNASSRPVRLIAIGPLTNVALALKSDPSLASRLESIFFSGGAISVPGAVHAEMPSNPNAVAEWNLYIDPLAADQVFRSGVPLIIAPLDVTENQGPHPLLLSPVSIRQFATASKGRDTRLMARILLGWQLMQAQSTSPTDTAFWDLAAVTITTDLQICTDWRELNLHIVLEPDTLAGQTVAEPGKTSNAQVCLGGNRAAYEAVLGIINR